jgi:hypothetical protein
MNSLLPLVITMNSLLPLVIIIYMFNYQCSRVTVAVTKVCNYILIKKTKAVVHLF